MAPTKELLEELNALPPQFFGTVEITYQNGVAGLIRISRTRKLPQPNGKPLGVMDEPTRR